MLVLARVPYVFHGGKNCLSIRAEQTMCVVKDLDDHAVLTFEVHVYSIQERNASASKLFMRL